MIVTDRVQFRMPKDREYQFPAMAVLQAYVNGFENKMRQNDVAGVKCAKCDTKRTHQEKCMKCGETKSVPMATYKIVYSHDMDSEHWGMFLRAGYVITTASTELDGIDMMVDMSDNKINAHKSSGKHVSQICGMLAGTGATPLPGITRRVPRCGDWQWATIDPFVVTGLPKLTGDEIISMEDQKYTGFIGRASWESYLVASMGMPIIEIVPEGRPRAWLSKFLNGGYRVIEHGVDVDWAIQEATASVHQELTKMAKKKGAVNV